ncbi:hypothetical protein CTAYLR_005653 [Chrysophaeum taylorii]|uniref:Farnesyl pyrophosphate synthase n=1 Tax=Chrysophaeum taylorii TaxID=2483200 RepID=A0AAD7UME1_9STRA|nr:hypothetical protein CTAYLR_005653 [Chrysophaeum taylorii]
MWLYEAGIVGGVGGVAYAAVAAVAGPPDPTEVAKCCVVILTVGVAIFALKKSAKKTAEYPATVPTPPPRAYPKYELTKESFVKICEILIDEAVDDLAAYETRVSEREWIRKMLAYNVLGGKMNRGLMVVEAGRLIFQDRNIPITNDDLCRFAVLGCCIEWLQGWLLVADDFMDSSVTRRGQPCWYRVEGVDKIAINDAFLIEMLMFKAIKRHFGHLSCYAQLVDLVMETTLQTELGQLLDLRCEHVGLNDFTLDRWTLIVKYKTAFYSFYLPVAMGMTLAGITDSREFDAARNILVVMGIYFQAQDDFLDAFGTPEQIGKIGTDIQDKKCGWLFVHAYHSLCDPKQKAYLDKHYGNCSVGSREEQNIKKIYADVGLPKLYADYEQASYDKIVSLKHAVKIVPWSVFEAFLKKIYKRSK